MNWYKEGVPIRSDPNDPRVRIHMSGSQGLYLLEILDARPSDSGQYSLVAATPKAQTACPVNVTVEPSANSTKPLDDLETILPEGTSLEIVASPTSKAFPKGAEIMVTAEPAIGVELSEPLEKLEFKVAPSQSGKGPEQTTIGGLHAQDAPRLMTQVPAMGAEAPDDLTGLEPGQKVGIPANLQAMGASSAGSDVSSPGASNMADLASGASPQLSEIPSDQVTSHDRDTDQKNVVMQVSESSPDVVVIELVQSKDGQKPTSDQAKLTTTPTDINTLADTSPEAKSKPVNDILVDGDTPIKNISMEDKPKPYENSRSLHPPLGSGADGSGEDSADNDSPNSSRKVKKTRKQHEAVKESLNLKAGHKPWDSDSSDDSSDLSEPDLKYGKIPEEKDKKKVSPGKDPVSVVTEEPVTKQGDVLESSTPIKVQVALDEDTPVTQLTPVDEEKLSKPQAPSTDKEIIDVKEAVPGAPVFTVRPEGVVVNIGDDIRLTCRVQGKEATFGISFCVASWRVE